MKISIVGYYTTQVGELWDQGLYDLIAEAVIGSLKNASLEPKTVEAVFVASKAVGSFNKQRHLNALVSELFGHYPPTMRVEGACASGGLALLAAEYALRSGAYQTAMVLGVEKMSDCEIGQTTSILATAANTQSESGSTFPGLYALLAQAHQQEFGTTREMLSAVAVKNHRHALSNPRAQYHREFSIQQVNKSPLVADPLRLLDCSPVSDGASAVILTTKRTKKRASIIGAGHGQDSLDLVGRRSLTTIDATQRAAKQAYQQAGIKPSQVAAAEVHDCFTIAEIMAIEDLGFFAKGEGGSATLNDKTTCGSRVVINPSGGLKAFGHPVGATGVKQLAFLAEKVEQDEYKHALTHNVGGSGATAVVHIISK